MSTQKLFDASLPSSIQKAAEILKRGGLVAFPTETVYGLGADATNDKAVCRVFEVKKRPTFDPLIVHVPSAREAFQLCRDVPEEARKLAEAYWPGPLTLVLPKKETVSDLVTSGLDTVALRVPNHPAALDLLRNFGKPIAAPSANLFGYTSPTSAQHVLEDLGESVDMVLDGGDCLVGVESTVLKFENKKGMILRPGGIPEEDLKRFVSLAERGNAPQERLESPGLLESHYSPWTKMVLLPSAFKDFSSEWKQTHLRAGLLSFRGLDPNTLFETVVTLSPTGDLTEAAANLFQGIRKLDKMNLDVILAEPVPEKGIGCAIMDRLRKASCGRTIESLKSH